MTSSMAALCRNNYVHRGGRRLGIALHMYVERSLDSASLILNLRGSLTLALGRRQQVLGFERLSLCPSCLLACLIVCMHVWLHV